MEQDLSSTYMVVGCRIVVLRYELNARMHIMIWQIENNNNIKTRQILENQVSSLLSGEVQLHFSQLHPGKYVFKKDK